MGLVFAALWWTSIAVVTILLAFIGAILGAVLIFAVPTTFFFCKALKSDWKEVQAILSATATDLKEDAELLIAGPSSSATEQAKGPETGKTDLKAGLGKKDESVARKELDDPESQSALLEPAGFDASDPDDDFAPVKSGNFPSAKSASMYGRKVAVVIPTLNEEAALPATLDRLNQLHPAVSVIVVADGGSTDNTVSIAEARGAVVVHCAEKGRSKQMNAGAREAARRMREQDDEEGAEAMMGSISGDSMICFLHADTQVPLDLVSILQSKFAEPATCCAAFVPLISVPGKVFWGLSFLHAGKSWFLAFFQSPSAFFKGLRIFYGDQAMCCCARDFFRVGGFDESIPVFEDADLCERLHNEMGPGGLPGKACLIPRLVVTSARRLGKEAWKMLLTDLYFAWRYFRRISPEELHELYNRLYKDVR